MCDTKALIARLVGTSVAGMILALFKPAPIRNHSHDINYVSSQIGVSEIDILKRLIHNQFRAFSDHIDNSLFFYSFVSHVLLEINCQQQL